MSAHEVFFIVFMSVTISEVVHLAIDVFISSKRASKGQNQ